MVVILLTAFTRLRLCCDIKAILALCAGWSGVVEQVMMEALQDSIFKNVVARQSRVNLDVVVHGSIDSTNSWCLAQQKAGRRLPFACFAEEQTSGKGRRGKNWVVKSHSNIAMSVAWPFDLSNQPVHLLSLSVAITIAQTLEHFGLQHVQIKWPNDVYVQDKKIAGVLIETQPIRDGGATGNNEKDASIAVVIGVGLNYDMSALVTEEVLSLTDICEQFALQENSLLPVRQDVASSLLVNIVSICQDLQEFVASNFELFSSRYDYCKGKNVEIVLDNEVSLSGVAQGINERAELLVLVDGELQIFNSAEVSVRAKGEEVSQ